MAVEFFVKIMASHVAKNKKAYLAYLKDAIELFRTGRKEVFIFGCGGTGKTTLATLLDGEISIGEVTGAYVLSPNTEESEIEEKRFGKVFTVPGQEKHHDNHWGPLLDAVKRSKNPLVINVVSHGYHAISRTPIRKVHSLSGGITDKSVRAFLEEQRKNEVRFLKYMVGNLRQFPGDLDLVTIVTKQDLWWAEREKVQTHYTEISSGDVTKDTPADETTYEDQIRLLESAVGTGSFNHTLVSASLGHINLLTSKGALVAPVAAGYDASLLHSNFANLINTLRAFY